MRLPIDCQGIVMTPITNRFRGGLRTPIIRDNHFETRGAGLLRQRLQTSTENAPVVVSGHNNAEEWDGLDGYFVRHGLLLSSKNINNSSDLQFLQPVPTVWRPQEILVGFPLDFVHRPLTITDMSPNSDWLSPQMHPRLTRQDVHVWRASLSSDPQVFRRLESTLSSDERDRAQRFIFERDRNSFTVARGILRHLLGEYLSCQPHTIEFSYGSNGKPELAGSRLNLPIRFNLSHSHGVALFAITLGRRVGIDVELVRTEAAGKDIAARYFSAQETNELRGLPTEQQAEGFFLCWTRKEAYVKAKGDGLQIPLNSFHVSLSPGQPATLSAHDEAVWSIESFVPLDDEPHTRVAALVVEGRNHSTRFFEWAPKIGARELSSD
jgi:4'-phosphopantetheinyl transferase